MIREKENILFEEWKATVPQDAGACFVTDGIVDETVWQNAKCKVLYLLKEVNGAESSWDERDYLKKYNIEEQYIATHSPTINNLIRWHYGITRGTDKRWDEVEQILRSKEEQNLLLSEMCLVNLKKTGGGGIVDWDMFEKYFAREENRDYLKRQLALYSPDVVVCGGTAYYLSVLYGVEYNQWQETSRGVRYLEYNGTIYLDYCHPQNRGPKNLIYFGLIDAINEITS